MATAIQAEQTLRTKTNNRLHAVEETTKFKTKPSFVTTTYHQTEYAARVYIADQLKAAKQLGINFTCFYKGV